MKAFEVFINGHFLCRAGIGEEGVLSAIVSWVGNKGLLEKDMYHLHLGGLDSATNEHIEWAVPTIGVGTEITVRIVEANTVDPPSKRSPANRDTVSEEG